MATTHSPQSVITTDDVVYASLAGGGGYAQPPPGESGHRDPPPGPAMPAAAEPQRQPLEVHFWRLAIRVIQSRHVEQAAKIAAAGLVESLGGGRLAVGIVRPDGKSCRLCALSSVPQIDRRSERSQALEAALDEVLLCGRETALGAMDSVNASRKPLPLKAHERLARATGSRTVVGVPLKSREVPTAVLLWFDEGAEAKRAPSGPLDATVIQSVFARSGEILGPVFEAVVRAERSPLGRVRDRIQEVTSGQKRRTILVGTMLLACVLLVPLPYRPACTARLEPTSRRYVVAPFESTLEKTLVQPGDVVYEDQVVARLDGGELRMDLARVKAEREQAIGRYRKALAEDKPTETRYAQLEVDEKTLERDKLASRQERLQIKSPVGGVVLSGELERAEGAALTTGQTLLEIAPLEDLLVEIAVPEDQLRFVQAGRSVSLKLDAFPGRKWNGTIERVRPQAEIRDARNVFIAEVRLQNEEGSLRPGMKGHAKVSGPIRPLAWILFHRPYEAMRQWVGW